MPDLWTDPESDPRTYDNPQGEKATYQEYLTNYRLTLRMKGEGLSAEQLALRSVPPSNLSLLGLVRHMAAVEHSWFQRVAQATGEKPIYWTPDDRDHDFNGAVGDDETVEDAFSTWQREITKADEWFASVPEADLGRELSRPDGDVVSIRDMVVHMIEEYARHCGHADLLRECIDGRTGQ
ncbi:DinB family protein [Nocardioides immobilis]|uniref:DinB family protein n=1 Tax=Nocardioides immobilis TaxID=2049295 RepID=A0A417Y5T2_9ACTN|nr:DinB family protein [Nocardioides immobilis]RHW28058.1 DinB family protein [Nocardioides immobilis]